MRRLGAALLALVFLLGQVGGAAAQACRGTLYLTIDTGWSHEAEQIAEILHRHRVVATLFVTNEPTWRGDRTLDDSWAPFWRARAAEGFVFASHTWRHWYFSGDAGPGRVRYASRAGEGATVLDGAALCQELDAPMARLRQLVPTATILPLWRAPGGRLTPNATAMASACGLRHQGWSGNGFLGDELNADAYPNRALLNRALANVRDGEVLMMHWGVRSRRDPLAGVLDELISGLQARGFCFATLPAGGR